MKVQFPAVTAIALCTAFFAQTGFAGTGTGTGAGTGDDDDAVAVAAMFKKLDANGDGFVTMKEAKANADVFEAFTDGDSNEDHKLSMDEFSKMKIDE